MKPIVNVPTYYTNLLKQGTRNYFQPHSYKSFCISVI